MEYFEFEALLPTGEQIKSTFMGSKLEFESMIKSNKFTIIKLKITKKTLKNRELNIKDMLNFSEELHYLLSSSIPIDSAIKLLLKTVQLEQYKIFLEKIYQGISSGDRFSKTFYEVCVDMKIKIDPLAISLVQTSEEIGELKNGVKNMYEFLEFQNSIKNQVKQALAYPIFLLLMSFVVSFVIFFLIIPKFATIFTPEEFEQLPILSKTILNMGLFVNDYSFQILGIIVIFIVLMIVFFRYINWSNLMYKLPFLSTLIIEMQISIVYGALSKMLNGGISLDKSIHLLHNMNFIDKIKDLLKASMYEIKRGNRLSEFFSINSIISPNDIALISVGENSATLDKVFNSLSKKHNDFFMEKVSKILALLEPIIIVFLGIFIAFIVVAIMMSIMSITDITA